jgi:hypothetical protein
VFVNGGIILLSGVDAVPAVIWRMDVELDPQLPGAGEINVTGMVNGGNLCIIFLRDMVYYFSSRMMIG